MAEGQDRAGDRASPRGGVGAALRLWLMMVPLLDGILWALMLGVISLGNPARPLIDGGPEERRAKVLLLVTLPLAPGFFALTIGRLSGWAGFLLAVPTYLAANVVFLRSLGYLTFLRVVPVLLALCFLYRFVKGRKDDPVPSERLLWASYAATVAGELLVGVVRYYVAP